MRPKSLGHFMRITSFFFSVIMVVSSIHVGAMDTDDHENKPLLENVLSLHDVKIQVEKSIKTYEAFVASKLGCCLCRALITLFEPAAHKPTLEKLARLTALSTTVHNSTSLESLAQQLASFYESSTPDITNSRHGHCFLQSLAQVITRVENDSDAVDENLCDVCFERHKTMAALPCGHIKSCRLCLTDLKWTAQESQCMACRAVVQAYVLVDTPCPACKISKPNYIAECGHPSWCEECFLDHKEEFCRTCTMASSNHKKLYY